LIAEATPCFSRGSEATIAVVAGDPASAMPAPNGSRPARKCQYVESVPSVERTMKPVAISPSPIGPVTRTPTWAAILGAKRESGMTTTAIGSSAAAACSGP